VSRRLALALAVLAFLAVSALLARWLAADGVERGKVEDLLAAQARGDAGAMARLLDRCDAGCAARLRALTRRLAAPGEVRIVRYDSETARALGASSGPTRVVWTLPGRLTTVQCVQVRRDGNALTGRSITLVRLSAPIGRESGC
jgi:hypothetical protein